MKYAVEIADKKSINKAAETLFVGQSALSRAVKELESSLGVTVFERSAKGMLPTPEGEAFLHCARAVLKQVNDIENMFDGEEEKKKRFSLSGPRASYIADAFAAFAVSLDDVERYELLYRETNSMRTIKNVLREDYNLGILRYASAFDGYYLSMMEEKGLAHELIAEFRYVLAVRSDSPLVGLDKITDNSLKGLTEIAHADPYVPSLPFAEVKKEELSEDSEKRIFVFERASQFELLSRDPSFYMWVSPVSDELLGRYGLVQLGGYENGKLYKDVLIHKKNYALSELDEAFIEQLIASKRKTLSDS